MASTKGKIHEVFTSTLDAIVEANRAAYEGAEAGGGRKWFAPPTNEGWDGNPQDIPGLATAFDRQEIETNYEEVFQDPSNVGTVGDVISLKTQSDYVACVERAYRSRHATSVRCIAHHLGRRRGHGDAESLFNAGITKFAQDALIASQENI